LLHGIGWWLPQVLKLRIGFLPAPTFGVLQPVALTAGFENVAREGIEGLVECFLTQYVYDRVWTLVENHVDLCTNSIDESAALSSAVERGCRSQIQNLIEDLRTEG